jgi:Tol biopolymer transport system component
MGTPSILSRCLTVAATFGLALAFAAPAAHATYPGANGRIAFSSDLRPGGPHEIETEVFTINSDGSERTQLTDTPGPDGIVDWSPDGARIAFGSSREGNPEIFVMNADGSDPQRITDDPAADGEPRWSPDGSQFVFFSTRSGNGDVFLMNTDGSGVTQLTDDPGTDIWPDWSVDGSLIVFTSTRSGHAAVYTMQPDGSDVRKLTDDGMEAGQADWSPDGTKLALVNNYCSKCPHGRPQSDIFVLTLATGELQQLTHTFGNNLNPEWSPDGTMIAFWHAPANPFQNNTDIYVMNADGSDLTNVTNTPNLREYVPDWGAASA